MKTIPLSKGYVALVDDEDFERFGHLRWHASVGPKGEVYARRHAPKGEVPSIIYLHRAVIGAWPDDEVDHENGDTLDCQRANLKPGTHAQNMWNIHTLPRGKIALRGVHINRHGFPQSAIKAGGKSIQLGTFDTPDLASRAYEEAVRLREAGLPVTRSPLARKQNAPWSLRD